GTTSASAAGWSRLSTLRGTPSMYQGLENQGAHLGEGLRRVLGRSGRDFNVNRLGSMISVHFSKQPVNNFEAAAQSDNQFFNRFFHNMLGRGVYLPPSAFESWFLSNALSQEDLEYTLEAAA